MADHKQPDAKEAVKKTHVRFTFGRDITDEELKKLQASTDALEVRKARAADGHHEDHSHHDSLQA